MPLVYIPEGFTQSGSVVKQMGIDVYEKLVVHYRYQNPDSAKHYALLGLSLAKKKRDLEGEARMLNQLGMIDDNLGYFNDSRVKYLRALELYKIVDQPKGVIKLLVRLGVVENRKGNYDKAIDYFFKALKVSEKNKDSAGLRESYVTLGEVYAHQKNYVRALKYYEKAQELNDKLPLSNITLNLYNDKGAAYRELGNFNESIRYYERGIALSNTAEMMGLHISLMNGLAKTYLYSGDQRKAIVLLKGALERSRNIQNFIREVSSLKGLAESYEKSNPDSGLVYLNQALRLAKEKKASKVVLELLDDIATLESINGNFKKAYLIKNQQYTIADSVYFKDISEKISSLQAQYELSKSKADIQELRFQNNRQALETRVMVWIIVASIIAIGFLSFYFLKIRNLNRLLNGANRALTDSNHVKDKLFSVLGHDLRSPLASILNVLYLIDEGMLTDEERSMMIKKLAVSCNASMETLDMLLKWGQMQLKGVKISKVPLFSRSIVERNIRLLSGAADEKSITIENRISDDLEILADADHFDFIIRNLMSNAVKFTYSGGHVAVSAEKLDANDVRFCISDNGIGIDRDRLLSVFEINNISTKGTNNEKGTSLGLVMCKEFVEANGGKIWVESEIGRGAKFFFTVVSK